MTGWRLAWRIARRELHARFRGLRLLLVCLFLGVGALAAIGSLTQAISGELAARGRVILGGDVEFAVSQRGPTAEERAAISELGSLSETIRLQSMAIRDTPAGPRTVPVELKAVDAAYPLYGALTLTDGRAVRAPAATQVYIAPALVDRLGVRAGETLRFGNARFTVGGIIATEPDRLGEGFTLGPVAILSNDGMARTGLIQPGSLYETKIRVRMTGGDPADAADAIKAEFPLGGWETRTRDRAAPGASRFIGRMGQFLTLVGLAALIIAGIGVGNGVAAYLAARRGGIATLKVLGATSGLIARVYLLQIVAVASIGIAAGLAVGVGAVPAIVWLAGDVLPVAPQFAVHPLPLALAAAYGLLIALAFAAPPLVAASEVPAAGLLRGLFDQRRPALRKVVPWMAAAGAALVALAVATSRDPLFSAGFLAAAAGVLLLLAGFGWLVRRTAARAPRPRRPLFRLAIAGLHRPGARTTTLVVALGLGLTLFVLLAAIRTSLDANIQRSVPERAPSLFALDVPRDREAEFRATIAAVEPRATVRTVPALRGTITGYGDTRVADLEELPEGAWALRGERGLTYAATPPPGSSVVEGRWWPADYAGPPLVSIDAELARILDLKIGDPLTYTVLGVERRATVASFRRIDWDTMGFNFVMVFSPTALSNVPHNLAATVDLPDGGEPAVMQALLPRFPSVSLIEVGGVIAQVRDIVSQMATAIAAAASIAILAGIAVLIGAITAARETRTYDSVILKTLGATRAQILGAQAIEYALLSAALAAVALALGMAGAWYVMTQIFEFDWLPDYPTVLATLAAGAGLTMTIGLLGALPILAARPARALREL
ncbi:ABC transporter permease [Sphingomonas gilva]|uniref:ABC transporter permease n=1 Tax=Sphingomonas gilva TaxID=2305907 RepID=A0A396RNQ7_9SPHN|nr:FtsX-like permease family protein [Sphingomonas gilva]RHW16832.1 ABC transporter permease [Sphingomonas gilva]